MIEETDYVRASNLLDPESPKKPEMAEGTRPFFEPCFTCLTIWTDEEKFNAHTHDGMLTPLSEEMRQEFLKEVARKRTEYYKGRVNK